MSLNDEQWRALCECIVEELDDVAASALTVETRLLEDLEFDSLLASSLAFELEERFGIVIEESRMADVCSVGDLARLISEELST